VLLGLKDPLFVTAGPEESLVSMVRARAAGRGVKMPTTLTAIKPQHLEATDQSFLLSTIAKLWLAGVEIDWSGFYANEKRRRVVLPTYPFERQRFWIDVNPRALSANKVPPVEPTGKNQNVSDWFYVPAWKQSTDFISIDDSAHFQQGSRWLMFTDDSSLATGMVAELTSRGAQVICVRKGEFFSCQAKGSYLINPSNGGDYEKLFNELGSSGDFDCRIVHLWSLFSRGEQLSRAELIEIATDEASSLVCMSQALAQAATQKTSVLIVTNGLIKITGDEALLPEKALLIGACKSIGQDYTSISSRVVDVAVPTSVGSREEELVERLLIEATHQCGDYVVAYRGSQRWIQNFERLKLETTASRPARLRQGGAYLIASGLNSIGLAIADHLARSGATRIALVDDLALPPREQWGTGLDTNLDQDELAQCLWQIWTIEEMGCEVLVINTDVSNREQMRQSVQQTLHRFGEINGVFQAPRSSGSKPVSAKEEIRDVQASQVKSLVALDEALKNVSLDFMVLFSLINSIPATGFEFTMPWAAAYLDAYANARSCRKSPVIAIRWSDWLLQADPEKANRMDLAAKERFPEHLKEYGIRFEEGMDAMSRILDAGLSQVTVCVQDLQTYIETANSRMLLAVEEQRSKPALRLHPRPTLGNAYVAPRNDVEKKILEIWQEMLGIDQIGTDDDFFELGGHSLLATRLFARLRSEFNVSLSLRSIFELPTVTSQAEMIAALSWTEKDLELQLSRETVEGEI